MSCGARGHENRTTGHTKLRLKIMHWNAEGVSNKKVELEDILDKVKRVGRKTWMTEEILQLMETRRQNKNNPAKYEEIHRKVRTLCKEAKETWLEKNCREIEKQHNSKNAKLMHKRIQELTN